MKTGRSNKFNRALGHIKSTNIDEKIRLLDEQPTNNTTQIYIDEPDTEVTTTLNPNLNELDLTQDSLSTGRDTTGLFMPDGTILTEEPPGDTSYILGPMAAMYYTWSYPWTMLGYIRQSDRRMVNLARVNGKLSDWDGSSGFSSYGQLTLEQAVWFRDVQKQPGATNDPSTYNYYAFYPGPPTQRPDKYGRYPCAITGISKRRDVTTGKKAEGKGLDPNWGLGPYLRKPSGYMFIKNEKTGEWEKKYYYDDGTSETERSGEITPGHPDYDAYMLGGGDEAAEQGYSRNEIIRGGYEEIQRQETQRLKQEWDNYLKQIQQQGQEGQDRINDPYGNNREYYGPAFNDNKTANTEREKLRQKDIATIGNPYDLKPEELNALRQIARDPDKGPGYARTVQRELEIAKLERLEKLNALSTRQWVEKNALQALNTYEKIGKGAEIASDVLSLLSLGVTGVQGIKSIPKLAQRAPTAIKNITRAVTPNKGLSSRGLRVGVTGVDKTGFDALTQGAKFRPSSKPQILGKGAYQAPKVGQVGGFGGGTGGARYAGSQGSLGGTQKPGGVIASLTPKNSARFPIIEPQSKVPASTFDKGARIVRDIQGGKYPRSVKAQQIQQQLSQAGFAQGQSSIPFSQLPTKSSASTSGKQFSQFIDNVGQNTSIGRWYNQGRNVRVPNENQASMSQLRADDKAQIGRFVNPKNPTNPDGSVRLTGGALPNPTKGYQVKQFVTGTGGATRSFNPFLGPGQGLRSGPTALSRQQVERPIRAMMNMTPGQQGLALGGSGAAAVGGSELLAPRAAEPNVSGKDLSKRISDRLPGYSIGDFAPTGKGDHYTAPILDPQGNPVINPRTGKPVTIGGGLRGKNQYSNSALGTLTNAINDIKGGFADKTGQSKGTTKYSVDKKKPVTKTASKARPQVQPQPTTRSTIKSMPASMMGKTSLQSPSSVVNPGVVVDPLNTNPYSMYNPTSGLSPKVKSTLGKFRSGTRAMRNIRFDYELEGDILTEQNRARILREIKNDVIVPEEKKEKLKGYHPKFGALHAEYDKLMQKAECPPSFKPMDETVWTKSDKKFNARLSQERKNEILDHLGTGDHYWEILTETGRKRSENALKEKYGDYTLVRKEHLVGDTLLFLVDENGKKETILQSEYSDRIARQIEEPLWEQETLNAPNDPLIKRIRSKLATQIDYPDKPSPMGYPDDMPPDMFNGFHPEYGKRSAYYGALDPQSADAMPATGDPETDQKVASQKTQPPLLQRVNKRRKQSGKPNS